MQSPHEVWRGAGCIRLLVTKDLSDNDPVSFGAGGAVPDPLLFLQKDVLMHRWRYPSLSLHGIEGAFSGSGAKTVIPRKVVGKFSIRLVPNMTPEVVSEQARGHWGIWGTRD